MVRLGQQGCICIELAKCEVTVTYRANQLSYSQLEGLWIQAGGNPSMAPLMAAIADAESGGNPGSVNPNDNYGTQSSFGLWQISTGTHQPPAPNWSDPLENAKLAVAKYKSQGLGAWGTYTSGAYLQYMQSGVTPSTAGVPTTGVASGDTAITTSSTSSNPNDPNRCILKIPIPLTNGICVLHARQAQEIVGSLILVGGVVVAGAGLILLGGYGLESSFAKRLGSQLGINKLANKRSATKRAAQRGPTQRQHEKATNQAFEEGRKTGHYDRDQETPF